MTMEAKLYAVADRIEPSRGRYRPRLCQPRRVYTQVPQTPADELRSLLLLYFAPVWCTRPDWMVRAEGGAPRIRSCLLC